MRSEFFAAAAIILFCASASFSQETESNVHAEKPASEERSFSFEAQQKVIVGSHHYQNTDTFVDLGLPKGFGINADFNAFRNDTSSWTPTITFGVGRTWNNLALAGTYAVSPLTDDTRSTAFDASASVKTDSENFATTVGGDILVTHNSQYLRFPKVTAEVDITQRTPTIIIKQQIYKTRLDAAFSQYTYNKNIPLIAAALNGKKLNRFSNFTGGLSGLIQGFPDHSEKFGARQELGPATLWASYGSIHFLDTALQLHATSDTEQYGVDFDLPKDFSTTLQYQHVRQTGQQGSDQYGLAISWSL